MRRLVVAIVVVLVMGALSGCGSSDSDGTSSKASTEKGGSSATHIVQRENSQQSVGSSSKGDSTDASIKSRSGDGASSASTETASKEEAPTKAKLVKNFKVIPVHVSGGGSGPLITKDGDNSIQEYGEEASESELGEAAEALHAYYVALSQDDWATACAYLSKGVKDGLESLASNSGGPKMSCEEVSATSYRPMLAKERSEQTEVDAISLRREGDQAFLIYHGPEYDTGGYYGPGDLYSMTLDFEDGSWKMGLAVGTTMGIPKSLAKQ